MLRQIIIAGCLLCNGNAIAGKVDSLRLTTGFDFSEGDFGQPAETTTESVPLTLRVDTKEWVFRMQSSHLEIEQVTETGLKTRERGQGDTILSVAKKSWFRWRGINYFDVGVRVKLPTADEQKRLGTGEKDWMLQIDSYRPSGKWMPFGKIGYRWNGDSDNKPRSDGFYGSFGVHYQHTQRFSSGMLLDYRTANTSRIEDGEELIPYMLVSMNQHWSLSIYGVFGLSAGSADRGGGVQLTYRQIN